MKRVEGGDLLTVTEAASVLEMDPDTVRWLIRAGKLDAIRTLGGQYRLRRDDIEAMLNGGEDQ